MPDVLRRAVARARHVRLDLVLGGFLVAAAMPGAALWPLLFVGVAILYARLDGQPARPLRDGWVFGLAAFGLGLTWIVYVVHVYGRLHLALAIVPWALLAAWCAVWIGFGQLLAARFGARAAPWVFAAALAAGEELRGHVLTGFPWNPWALPLTAVPQLAAPAGVYGSTGLGFLVLLASAGLVDLLRGPRRRGAVALGGVLALWGGAALWMQLRPDAVGEPLQVAIVQGNIDQDMKWSPQMKRMTLQKYEDLTRRALDRAADADLVVWPETAAPFYFQQGGPLQDWVKRIARDTGVPLMFGAPAYRSDGDGKIHLLNRAFLLDGDGQVVDTYDKVHVVPFGEYVPLQELLFFVEKMVEAIGSFAPGDGRRPVSLDGRRFGVLICYEAIFPYEVREFAAAGAQMFVQITNDAWFGDTPAPRQHLALAQMRVIETGLPLVRAANTGISGWIDRDGFVHGATGLYRPATVVADVPPGRPTPFVAFGWVWRWLWLGLGVAGLAALAGQWWFARRRRAELTGLHSDQEFP
jgi:apolipoprotein N-acyltransferase